MSSVPVPGAAPETAPLSQGARIVNTFIAPSKTFTDLRRSATWWAPFLLIIVIQVFLAAVVDKQVGYGKVVENQTQMSPKAVERMESMPPDQREQILKQQTAGTRVFWFAFPVALLILDLIFAGLYFGTFRLGFNSDIKYKTALAVVVLRQPALRGEKPDCRTISAGRCEYGYFHFSKPHRQQPGIFYDGGGFSFSVRSCFGH